MIGWGGRTVAMLTFNLSVVGSLYLNGKLH